MMRTSIIALAAILALSPAGAQTPAPDAPAKKADRQGRDDNDFESRQQRRADRLELLFGRLAAAENKRRADRIARNIMRRLSRPESDTSNLLMEQAGAAMGAERYGVALDLLDGVVRLSPDFAEGWNRRATVHFMRGDYGSSIADIERVLALEPRHWGALSGLSLMLISLERREEAVEIMDRALEVHPFLDKVKERRDKVAAELEGSDA